MTLGDWGIWM